MITVYIETSTKDYFGKEMNLQEQLEAYISTLRHLETIRASMKRGESYTANAFIAGWNASKNDWISTKDKLPEPETYVLTICKGIPCVLSMEWDHPTYEDSYKSYLYWSDKEMYDTIEDERVTHWMELPELPND